VKIGLLGGSFDPIHWGHVEPAREALERFGLDKVIYLPTATPPHKSDQEMAPAHHRYAMVELALVHEERMEVSPLELTPGRTAYTIDTVEHFAAESPQAEIYLLIGADSLVQLPTWKRGLELPLEARLIVLARPGWERERTLGELPAELAARVESGRIEFLGNRPMEASSTEIRATLARGERPPAGWMPELVLEYCLKNRLYSA
jgi:nicotinate-nucleotide adenylyltransferase